MKAYLALLIGAALIIACGTSGAQEVKITKQQVPAKVMQAFQSQYPKAEMHGFNREVEHGKTYYEIESVEGKRHRDVLFAADGTVAEVEESISKSELPSAVQTALYSEFPKVRVSHIDRSIRGAVTHYEVVIASGKHQKKTEIVFGEDGTLLKDED